MQQHIYIVFKRMGRALMRGTQIVKCYLRNQYRRLYLQNITENWQAASKKLAKS